jgi:hypothetical protein
VKGPDIFSYMSSGIFFFKFPNFGNHESFSAVCIMTPLPDQRVFIVWRGYEHDGTHGCHRIRKNIH